MKIIFATNNPHKLQEAREILGDSFELSTPKEWGIIEDIPENESTLEGNALQKARYVHQRSGENCLADDTGLEVDALNGTPGVKSARYAGEGCDFRANIDLLLHNMEGVENRTARFRTVIALIYDGSEYLFEGEVEGVITTQEIGEGGFGYDGIFRPHGYTITFAEMAPQDKNRISHRGRALVSLISKSPLKDICGDICDAEQ